MAVCHLYNLPNELLIHLFLHKTTPELLLLTTVSRRISTIILRILQNRLTATVELDPISLLLKCHQPSTKVFQPPYFCTYNGTVGLSLYATEAEDEENIGTRLKQMRNMYSRFRPHPREVDQNGKRVLPRRGDVPGSRTFPGAAKEEYKGKTVKQTLSLEAHELFTQLVARINLVKLGPGHGLFTCIEEVEDGVIRVWKDWLADGATKDQSRRGAEVVENMDQDAGCLSNPHIKDVVLDDCGILWVGEFKNTGIRFNVKQSTFRRDRPIPIRADEDMPVSYEIEYDEVFVRTSRLLLTLEQSMAKEDNSSDKAVVFRSIR
ncbi:hypothetical protein ACEQ8H_002900 [Pleosporales sp. CAS-2024a]